MSKRFTLGPIQNPLRGLLHGSAALGWVLGAGALCGAPNLSTTLRTALVTCAWSQVGLYLVSTLYHCAPWSRASKRRMQRIDHCMIYVKIAGTLTPILVLGPEDWRRPALLGAVWAIAFVGIAQKLLVPGLNERASIPVQILQASLVLPAIAPFGTRFPGLPLALVCAAGFLQAAGAAIFVTQWPRLWPRVFSFHELFHLLVVAGSAFHYAVLTQALARIPIP